MEFLKNIINKKQEPIIYVGNVSTLTPLTVKFYASDTAISVKSTTHLAGLKVGSNVIMVKIQNQFIIIAIIGAY